MFISLTALQKLDLCAVVACGRRPLNDPKASIAAWIIFDRLHVRIRPVALVMRKRAASSGARKAESTRGVESCRQLMLKTQPPIPSYRNCSNSIELAAPLNLTVGSSG